MGWLQDTFGEDNIVSRVIENGKSVVQDWMDHFGGSTDGFDAIMDLNSGVDFTEDLTGESLMLPATDAFSDPATAAATTSYRDTITGPSTTGPTNILLSRYTKELTSEKVLFVSWVWSHSLPGEDVNGITQNQTESYELTWQLDYGNGRWQNDGSPETITVEPWKPAKDDDEPYSRAAFDQFKYAEHSINAEAKLYRVLIRPISVTYEVPVGNQMQKHTYWDSNVGVSNTLDVMGLNIKAPESIAIEIDANQVKITATPSEEQRDYCKKVEFQIINADANKIVNSSRILIDVNELGGSAVYVGQVPSGGNYKARCRTVYGQLNSSWGDWSDEVTSMMIAPEKITELKTYNKDGKDEKAVDNNYVFIAWTAVNGAKSYKIQVTEDTLWFDQNQGDKITTIEVTAPQGAPLPNNYHINFGDISSLLGKELYFRVIAVNKEGIDSKPTRVRSIAIGLPPAAPTVWAEKYSDVNTNKDGIKIYIMHNAPDGSDLDSISMFWYFASERGDPTKKRSVIWLKRMANAGDFYLDMKIGLKDGYSPELFPERDPTTGVVRWNGVDGNMAWVTLNPTAIVDGKPVFGDGDDIVFDVCTASVGSGHSGDWSPTSSISIYPEPELGLELEEFAQDGSMQPMGEKMSSYPLIVSYSTWTGDRQTAVSCDIRITADQSYEYVNEFGDKLVIPKDGEIFHRVIMLDDETDDMLFLYPTDVDFRNGIFYTVHATTMLDSGLKAEASVTFEPDLKYIDVFPNASVGIDKESLTASIRPYAMDSAGRFVENAKLSVYRKEYDGRFTLISDDITPDTKTEGENLIDFTKFFSSAMVDAIKKYDFKEEDRFAKHNGIHPDGPGDFMRFPKAKQYWEWANTKIFEFNKDNSTVSPDKKTVTLNSNQSIPTTRPDGKAIEQYDYVSINSALINQSTPFNVVYRFKGGPDHTVEFSSSSAYMRFAGELNYSGGEKIFEFNKSNSVFYVEDEQQCIITNDNIAVPRTRADGQTPIQSGDYMTVSSEWSDEFNPDKPISISYIFTPPSGLKNVSISNINGYIKCTGELDASGDPATEGVDELNEPKFDVLAMPFTNNENGNFIEVKVSSKGDKWDALPNFDKHPIRINENGGQSYTFSMNYVEFADYDVQLWGIHDNGGEWPLSTISNKKDDAGKRHLSDYIYIPDEFKRVYIRIPGIPKGKGIMIIGLSLKAGDGTEYINFVDGRHLGSNYYALFKDTFNPPTTVDKGILAKDVYSLVAPLSKTSMVAYTGYQRGLSTQPANWTSAEEGTGKLMSLAADRSYIARATEHGGLALNLRPKDGSSMYLLAPKESTRVLSPSTTANTYYFTMNLTGGQLVQINDLSLREKLDPRSGVNVVDPHPALNFARYRLVAKENSSGRVTVYDTRPIPVGEKAIVLQWDENWTDFVSYSTGTIIPSENAWAGTMLKLPYNIDITATIDKEITDVNYIGRENPVSYYGTHLSEKSKWTTVIPRDDVETIYALRRLQKYMGDVYVREPSGIGYWAHVDVEFPINHMTVTSTVNLTITRVEGGI